MVYCGGCGNSVDLDEDGCMPEDHAPTDCVLCELTIPRCSAVWAAAGELGPLCGDCEQGAPMAV